MLIREIHFRGNKDHPHGSPTLLKFVQEDDYPVQLVEGPVESGKTMACIGKLYKWMCTMPRCVDGIRRSRFIIVRPTYGELRTTVVKDILDVFPEEVYGVFSWSEPYSYKMKFLDVETELVFMAFHDITEAILKKLRSTQFTAGWLNEAQYAKLMLVTIVRDRCGRYPSKKMCPDWDREKRLILDNNAPPTYNHWIRLMRGDTAIPADMPKDQAMAYIKPDDWKFYKQPPAVLEVKDDQGNLLKYKVNPKAENLQWMGKKAYIGSIAGKSRDQIDRDYRNVTRPSRSGTPRYPQFDRDYHVAKQTLTPNDNLPLILGVDFGMTPAVVFEQVIDRTWYTYAELVFDNADAEELAEAINDVISRKFPFARNTGIQPWGDPQGGWKGSNRKKTSFTILRADGIPIHHPKAKDNPELRMTIGRKVLRDTVNRGPKVIIDPGCVRLIEALDGGATMRQVSVGDAVSVREEIVKNQHSHICEAWEYSKWGYGEGRDLLRSDNTAKPTGRRFDTMANQKGFGKPGRQWATVSRRAS
jgi:hypothetical protein